MNFFLNIFHKILIIFTGGMTEGIMITELVLVHANFLFKKDFVAKEIPADSVMSNRPEENRNQKTREIKFNFTKF